MKTTDKLNVIYEANRRFFRNTLPGLHDRLWKIMVNEQFKDKEAAFITHISSGQYELGIAIKNEPGFIPTGLIFNEMDYNDAEAVTMNLNEFVFELTPKNMLIIQLSSMMAGPVE